MTEGYISATKVEWEEDIWTEVHLWATEGACRSGHGWCKCTTCRTFKDNTIDDDDSKLLGNKAFKMERNHVNRIEQFISSSKCRCRACQLLRIHGEPKGMY